jgi:hypothetical protein
LLELKFGGRTGPGLLGANVNVRFFRAESLFSHAAGRGLDYAEVYLFFDHPGFYRRVYPGFDYFIQK